MLLIKTSKSRTNRTSLLSAAVWTQGGASRPLCVIRQQLHNSLCCDVMWAVGRGNSWRVE